MYCSIAKKKTSPPGIHGQNQAVHNSKQQFNGNHGKPTFPKKNSALTFLAFGRVNEKIQQGEHPIFLKSCNHQLRHVRQNQHHYKSDSSSCCVQPAGKNARKFIFFTGSKPSWYKKMDSTVWVVRPLPTKW